MQGQGTHAYFSRAAGKHRAREYLPKISRQRESTELLHTSASILGEHLNRPLPLLQMLWISKLIFFTCRVNTFETAAFVLVPGASQCTCEPFKRNVTVPQSPLGFLNISPIDVPNQMFWGLVSSLQVPRIGMPHVGHQPLTFQGEAPYLCDPS